MPRGLQGSIAIPGDKSISHRSLMFSALTPGTSKITGLLPSDDVHSTRDCLKALGAEILYTNQQQGELLVRGCQPWVEPKGLLDCGNSGTTIRLMSGLLAGQGLYCVMAGDDSLGSRPMGRIIQPLQQMGAKIRARSSDTRTPITIAPSGTLKAIQYTLPVASAQVKSAVLLAGLFAEGETQVHEPIASRDHTERMLRAMGAELHDTDGQHWYLPGEQANKLQPVDWHVPGDPSSAAFPLVASLLIPDSEVLLEQVGLNPTRTGVFDALRKMGAVIEVQNQREVGGEPVGDLLIRSADLQGDLTLEAADIPAMVDEIPILAVAGAFLNGTLTVRGAEELRKKETDRLAAVATEFAKLSIEVELLDDGFVLQGDPNRKLAPPKGMLESYGDHRIAMSLSILNLINNLRYEPARYVEWPIRDKDCVAVSYPTFFKHLKQLVGKRPIPAVYH